MSNKHFDLKLSELTTKRVIMLVLGIMFTVPVFTISTYRDESRSYTFGLKIVASYNESYGTEEFQLVFNEFVNEHKDLRTPLIYAIAYNITWKSGHEVSFSDLIKNNLAR